MDSVFSEFFGTALKLFALMTPPAVLSAFLSGTKSYPTARKRATAIHTGVAVFVIGVVLYFFGESIFGVFGFTLDAFRIGSGVLLFLTAVSLMNETTDHPSMPVDADISVVPLAIPLCMGPASIGTVMVMGASASTPQERLIGAAALLVASGGVLLLLLMAESVEKVLHRTGIAVLSKLTGLLLAAIAAQVIFTGIQSYLGRGLPGESSTPSGGPEEDAVFQLLKSLPYFGFGIHDYGAAPSHGFAQRSARYQHKARPFGAAGQAEVIARTEQNGSTRRNFEFLLKA